MNNIVITGAGAICSLADSPERLHEALCDGRTGFGPPTVFALDAAGPYHVAEVREFSARTYLGPRNLRPLDRTGQLAAVAAELALADSDWTVERRKTQELGLILGTMFCSVRTIGEFDRRAQKEGPQYASPLDFSNTVINAAAGQVAIWHQLRGVNSTIAAGATAGLHAIGYAAQLIRAGRAPSLVAGGAEELCFESFHGFLQAGYLARPDRGQPGCAVPFDRRRTGCALGEGAAFLVVEDEAVAAARGARVIGRIEGFGAGYDSRHDAEHRDGPNALAHAIARALADAGIPSSAIGAVAASAGGSPVLDAREASAIQAAIGADTPVTAMKSMLGETLGASGALHTIALLQSLRDGRLPGVAGFEQADPGVTLNVAGPGARPLHASRALVTAMAPEGNCCALVISA
jgi:3-oxoacyl-[acyl-carrier-protein] synthase II